MALLDDRKLHSAAEFCFEKCPETRKTVIKRRKAGGLCHFSKAYHRGTLLTGQLVNPTAGYMSGDELELTLNLAAQSEVALTSPSAARVFKTGGGRAKLCQKIYIGEGAFLDWWPEFFLLHQKASCTVETSIELKQGSELIWMECLSPGRVAHGELFAYSSLDMKFQIHRNGSPIVHERIKHIPAETGSWPIGVKGWKQTYYACVWITSQKLFRTPSLYKKLLELCKNEIEEEGHASVNYLEESTIVVRILAGHPLIMRRKLRQVRSLLAEEDSRFNHQFRKL